MNKRYGDWKGLQGKVYRLWKTDKGFEVEMVWGGNGVIFSADNVKECKMFLKRECRAERIIHQ